MISRRNFLLIVPLFFFLSFPLWKNPVGNFLAPRGGFDPDFIDKTKIKRTFSMQKVNIQQSENGRKTAEIRATKADTSSVRSEYILDNVDADIIDDFGKVINVKSQDGSYTGAIRRLKLIHKVVVHSTEDDFTLRTNLLFYSDRKRKVHSPRKTIIEGDGITIRGSSFDYDLNKRYYQVGGRVHCFIEGYSLTDTHP